MCIRDRAKKSRKDMKAPSKEKSNFLGASGRNMTYKDLKLSLIHISALFCGDLFHKAETMDQELAEICYNELIEGFWIYAISGNHSLILQLSISLRAATVIDFSCMLFPSGTPY